MTRVGSKRLKRKPIEEEVTIDIIDNKRRRSGRLASIQTRPLELIDADSRPVRITRAKRNSIKESRDDEEASGSSGPRGNDDIGSIKDIVEKIDELLEDGGKENIQEYLKILESDQRDEVKVLIKDLKVRMQMRTAEEKRLYEMMSYERKAVEMERDAFDGSEAEFGEHLKKTFYIVGVDEVGVGPLAGPIVSCAVAFQYPILLQVLNLLEGINDSKKLSIAKRKELSKIIERDCCTTYNLGVVTAKEVDELNPLQGSIVAMGRAVTHLDLPTSSSVHVLVDHHTIPHLPKDTFKDQTSITKGDAKSIAIAAASIIAKVYRDDYMLKLHELHPNFGFDRNAGYGTPQHFKELREGHLCPEHRLTFAPVRVAHRKTNGLAPEDPPLKKRSRAAKVFIEPASKEDPASSEEELTCDQPTAIIEGNIKAAEKVATTPTIFSSAWWSSWFVSKSS